MSTEENYFSLLYQMVIEFITDNQTQIQQCFTGRIITYKLSNRSLADFPYNMEITTSSPLTKQGYITMYRGTTPGNNNQRTVFEMKFRNCSDTMIIFNRDTTHKQTIHSNRPALCYFIELINQNIKTDNHMPLLQKLQKIK